MNKFLQFKTLLPRYFNALRNKNTPKSAKIALIAAILYLVLPADLLPDVFPILGYIDDALIMTILISLSNKLIPEEIKKEEKN